MFLKTQDDLHKLLEEYPLDRYSITISGGEERIFPTLGILTDSLNIFYEGDEVVLWAYGEVLKYGKNGIQVINIFKKTKQDEGLAREYPIMLNEEWLIDINCSELKRKRKEEMINKFYNSIEEFSNHYNGLKEQLRLLDRLELDEILRNPEQLSKNSDMRIFYAYYQQSQSDYLASQYFKIIDNDSQSFNFHKILENAKDNGIIQSITYEEIKKKLDEFRSSENVIQKYRNKYGAHHDASMFHEYNKSERISSTGIQQTRSIVEPPIFREKLKELMDFIDKTINENFSPQIRFGPGGGHSQTRFTLKLISNN